MENKTNNINLISLKSEKTIKNLLSYIWLISSICLAYGFAKIITNPEFFGGFIKNYSQFNMRVIEIFVSLNIFNMLWRQKYVVLSLIIQSIFLVGLLNYPQNTFVVGTYIQFLLTVYLMSNQSINIAKSITEKLRSDESSLSTYLLFKTFTLFFALVFILIGGNLVKNFVLSF